LSTLPGGKIDAKAAAALIAAAASGGDPEIANKIIEKMLAGESRCYDLKDIFDEKIGEIICVFHPNYCYFLQKNYHNIGF
jgi:hypothetical protein